MTSNKLNDFLALLPIEALSRLQLEPHKIALYTTLDSVDVLNTFSEEINTPTLTYEKCMYIAAKHPIQPLKTYNDLLTRK